MNRTQLTYYFLIVLYILNPFVGILVLLNYLYQFKVKNPTKYYRLFILFLALFLSLVNITKIPENDLLAHGFVYLKVSRFSLIEYLIHVGKEPVFYIFNYLFYHISNGSFRLWVFTISFISYLLLLLAVLKFSLHNSFSKGQILMAFVLASFFPQMFSLSAHLLRQFVASSIFVYFFVDRICENKNKWWLPIIGMLVHFSSILIFPLVYLKFLGDFKKYKILNVVILVCLLFYQKIAQFLLIILGNINYFLSYVLIRASTNTTFDLGGFQFMNFVLMLFMLGVSFLYLYKKRRENNSKINNIENYNKNRHFIFVLVILSVFIMANLNQSELSNRLFFYLFFFFPFIIPLCFDLNIKMNHSYLSYSISNLFILFFLYRLEFGVWTYNSIIQILIKPTIFYLFEPEFILSHIQ